jgi:hypothetical protein
MRSTPMNSTIQVAVVIAGDVNSSSSRLFGGRDYDIGY